MSNQSNPDPSDAVYAHEVPAERPWSHILKRGQTLRIVDIEGQQAVDALLYCAEDPAERYSAQDTLRVQGSAYVELGTQLVSNKGRVMARITADTCGRHDTSAGCCSCESNAGALRRADANTSTPAGRTSSSSFPSTAWPSATSSPT